MQFGKYILTDWICSNDDYYNRYDKSRLFSVSIMRVKQNYHVLGLSLWKVSFYAEAAYLQNIFNELYSESIIDSRISIQKTIDNFLIRMEKLMVFS